MIRERLGSLVSGGGSTMEQIVLASQNGWLQMDVACVLASKEGIGAIKKANSYGIALEIVNPDEFRGDDGKVDQYGFGQVILRSLQKHGVTVVTQNGWLPLTPENVIDTYKDAIFNQHPGPVPEFGGKGMYGRRVHAARLLFTRMTKRDYWTEAIAQRVHEDYDRGVVVKSQQVEIFPGDIVDDLQQRVLPIEHGVQIELLKDVTRGEVKEVERKFLLIKPGEEHVLFEAKKIAKLLYPNG